MVTRWALWYRDNNTRIVEERRLKRQAMLLRAINYLGAQCIDCGYHVDFRGLQFDHVGVKTATISSLLGRSWKCVKEELDQCELRCGTCHNIQTAERGQQRTGTGRPRTGGE